MHSDRYRQYYEDNTMGQQFPSPSMEKLSRFFERTGVQKILDFYCGTGRNSIFLSQEGFEVTGFDGSEMVINIALEAQRKNESTVIFELHNNQSGLPYSDSYFDSVIAVRALYQADLSKIKSDIREIRRVTRAGGYLYLESDQVIVWKNRNNWGQIRTSEKGTYVHEDGSYYHYFTKAELRTLFKGFKIIRFFFRDRRFYVLYQKILTEQDDL